LSVFAQLRTEHSLGNYRIGVTLVAITACTLVAFTFPAPVLIIFVGVIVLFVGVRSPEWALALYALSMVFEYIPLTSQFKIAVPTALGAFFLATAFIHMAVTRNSARLRSRIPCLVICFLFLVLVSAIENPGWAFSHLRGIVTFVALGATTYASGRLLIRPKRPWYVVWGLAIGATLVSVLTIHESATGHFNEFKLFTGSSERAYGLSDPNYAAATLVTLLPFLVALFVAFRSLLVKLLMASALGLLIVAVTMTASRGGLLGVLAVTAATLLWVPVPRGRISVAENFKGTAFILPNWPRVGPAALLICTLGLGVILAPNLFWERTNATLDRSSVFQKEARVKIWKEYLDKWQEAPLWGHGPGYIDFAVANQSIETPHNTEIELMIEVGLVGAFAFLLLNGIVWWEALKARKLLAKQGQTRLSILSGAVAASLVGYHVTAFFLTRATTKELWISFGLVAALHHIAKAGHKVD
jgi:O-antigen ligase